MEILKKVKFSLHIFNVIIVLGFIFGIVYARFTHKGVWGFIWATYFYVMFGLVSMIIMGIINAKKEALEAPI